MMSFYVGFLMGWWVTFKLMIGMMAVELISRRLMGGWVLYVEHACMGKHKQRSSVVLALLK